MLSPIKLVETASQIVSQIMQSTVLTRQFKEAQISLNLAKHQLIKDNETRWNSKYKMLLRLQVNF
jgi:hypothetical protein